MKLAGAHEVRGTSGLSRPERSGEQVVRGTTELRGRSRSVRPNPQTNIFSERVFPKSVNSLTMKLTESVNGG